MSWEAFRKSTAHQGAKAPKVVTVGQGGNIGIPGHAMARIGLVYSPARLAVLFDRERSVMGFRAADDDDASAWRVRQVRHRWNISVPRFVSHYGIKLGRYDFAVTEGNRPMIVVEVES